jgi:hypothetical protein
MGYSTDFEGSLKPSKPFTKEQTDYINLFSNTRRMGRDVEKLNKVYKGKYGFMGTHEYGIEGEYFAHNDGHHGQEDDGTILDNNRPPITQPGLWCQWVINEDGEVAWDGGEKFYFYVEWLQYMIDNFFLLWDIDLNGEILWQGEDQGDIGKIQVKDNKIKILKGRITFD